MKNKGIVFLCAAVAGIAAFMIVTNGDSSRNNEPAVSGTSSSIFNFSESSTEENVSSHTIISYPKPVEESSHQSSENSQEINRQPSEWYKHSIEPSVVLESSEEENSYTDSVFYTQGIYKNNPKGYPEKFMRSSAKTLEGTTIIVSVFANDNNTAWTFDQQDNDIRYEMMKNMEIACDWLEAQSRNYGKEADLIFSFDYASGLAYTAQFYEDATSEMTGEVYSSEMSFAENYIDTEALLERYQADNVIYIYFFDTSFSGTARPFSLSHISADYCDYECITLYTRFNEIISPPATMAHEILHCFGAYDLYYASEIPQEYVDYCTENGSNDIMFTVNMGDEITVDMTDLAAYYVGLTDYCSEVSEWGLPVAERFEQ